MSISIRFAVNRLLYQSIGSILITLLASSYLALTTLQEQPAETTAKAAVVISKPTRA